MTYDGALSLFDADDVPQAVGHLERFTARWRLVGAGLSNVWRFGDLHLDAPSGRLLLRGPNGTGKTTALEALWPYLLDLNPQRLAAGKARPTSLSLLMREGANGAKRRCGYLWLTLAAPHGEGTFSYGVRLLYSESSSPAVKPTPFMIPGVPLRDVPLYGPDRGFVSAEVFSETVANAGGTVFPDEEAYVAHLSTRLWAAGDRDIEDLSRRIRAVRNPTLLGDLSPRQAAETLREALPGVSDDIVTATAEALAESDATREAFERDRAAATALDRFAEAWAGHVVEVLNQAHTEVTDATATALRAEKHRDARERQLAEARHALTAARKAHDRLTRRGEELDAKLAALEESEAYKAAGRLGELRQRVDAERRAGDFALDAFRKTVGAARERAEALRTTAGELEAEFEDLVRDATAVDPGAVPDRPLLGCMTRPREAYLVGDVSVDPGPCTVVDTDGGRADALASNWNGLAEEHRRRADQAVLALADRRETDGAEAAAKRLAESARQLRAQAEEQGQRLARQVRAAREAVRHLVEAAGAWYADHGDLARTVQATYREDHPEASGEEHLAWLAPDLAALGEQEPAEVLSEVERLAAVVATVGGTARSALRHRAGLALAEAERLGKERDQLRTEARALRDGKLLPIPRPEWAGPADDGAAFADAVDWRPGVDDPDTRARVELALAASGLLGAALTPNGVRTAAWYVEPAGYQMEPNLSAVLTVDRDHPRAALAAAVLCRVPLVGTAGEPASAGGLVIGRDGTFSAGPLRGRPPGVGDAGRLSPAEFVGARQRRRAALAKAVEYEAAADELDELARRQDDLARAYQRGAADVDRAVRAFPARAAAATAEAARASAAHILDGIQNEAERAGSAARKQAGEARTLRQEWERRTRERGLPIEVAELGGLRDGGQSRADSLDRLVRRLTQRLKPRLARLVAASEEDIRLCASLPAEHACTDTTVAGARRLETEYQELEAAVGLDSQAAMAQHQAAQHERSRLNADIRLALEQLNQANAAPIRLEAELRQAEARVTESRPPVAASQRRLRALVRVPGVADVLFGGDAGAALPGPPPSPEQRDGAVAVVERALRGRRTAGKRLLRERYDTSRAELAGLWTLDPGDPYENLDTFVLTHDGVTYTPPAAAVEGRRLRERAQAALDQAEESALRDFVIGRLPLAIGTAWVSIDDWIRDVNRKMQKAAASSGVGVRISKALSRDLSAAEQTVYRLACKETTRTAAQQQEVGEALQSLIAGAGGATMTERLMSAVDVRKWLDISYEIVRPDGQVGRWTSRTGLSGGERRLVVLAPMLAAVAAYYDQLDMAGLRLAALDEVPAEVDERGREGLARYIAELDLDLVCTSYLWDGAPGAWDGIDAWDLEAGPDGTVVGFPMLVRGPYPLPADNTEDAAP